jgi:hypothetical protein
VGVHEKVCAGQLEEGRLLISYRSTGLTLNVRTLMSGRNATPPSCDTQSSSPADQVPKQNRTGSFHVTVRG